MKTYFSNRVEQLYQFFKNELYVNNNHPFAERLIVVPSPAVKNWLTLRLADDPEFGIAMGIKMGFLDQTLKEVSINNKIQPSRLALSFTIESLLDQRWRNGQLDPQLHKYIGSPGSRRGQKRLVQMAETLASLFERYGIYASEMVKMWEKDPTQNWQAELWHELFRNDWSYPAAIYQSKQVQLKPNSSIHLFSISYISPVHHQFLEKLSPKIPVNYYILSPCQTFWSDVLTDREAGRLEAYWARRGVAEGEQQALEEYLSDRNPLLANYGSLGRSMARLLEYSEVEVFEEYIYSPAVEHEYGELLLDDFSFARSGEKLTLLEGIQADIGLMRNPEGSIKPNIDDTDSIQVHAAPTVLREVEVVRDLILREVEQKGIQPSEVLVMAPDISTYAPVIESVFGHKDCPIDYQLLDVGKIAGSSEIRLFMELLNLPTGRWDVVSIISLIERGVGFSKDEAARIVPWLRESDVRWGYDKQNREELLCRDHGECHLVEGKNRGTWTDAISRLVRGMVIQDDSQLDNTFELVSTTEGELLGKFITFLREIREELAPLTTQKMSIPDWIIHLEKLINKYLSISDDTKEYLFRTFEEIRRSSLRMSQTRVPFYSLKNRLQKAFEKKESGYRETHLSAVRFCSMLPMRAIPAKMIILMGMDEQSYPKKERPSNLDMMRMHRDLCDQVPSQVDYDRFLFLESILSAREMLVMTFVSRSVKEQPPSAVVTELVDYIRKAFGKEIKTHMHPALSFHHSLFSEKSMLKNYSQRDFTFASTYYKAAKTGKKESNLKLNVFEKGVYTDIDHFDKCLKNPLRHYLRTGLQLKISKDKGLMSEEEAFELDRLQTYLITKIGLKNDPEQVFRMIYEQDFLPAGVFGQLSKKKLEKDIAVIQESKKAFGIKNDSFFDMQFTDEVKKPKFEQGQWTLPPLPFGDNICLVGSIRECTESGIWLHHELNNKGVASSMGKYLIFNEAVRHFNLPFDAHVLFGKSAKKKNLDADIIEVPKRSVEKVFEDSQNSPCHLFVEWIEPILQRDAQALQKKIDDTLERSYDEYALWYLRNREMPSAGEIIDKWYEDAQAIYGSACENWLAKESADA